MTKLSAFGAQLKVGKSQVETATVLGAVTGSGNATVVTTCTGMTGSPITTSVAVLNGDTADTVAGKIRTALLAVANITALFDINGSGAQVRLVKKVAAANIANLNVSIDNGTCSGLTTAASSADTVAGVAPAAIAYIKSIGGASLAADTEDVTTHDSTAGFEEVIVTILRTGEVSLEIVYDPAEVTHAAASGLLDLYENKTLAYFDLIFLSTYNWTFSGYVTSFEPSASVDAALTAAVKIKITGSPVLE